MLPTPVRANIARSVGLAILTGSILSLSDSAFAIPFTVDSVGLLAPNPSNLSITEVGNTSLSNARTLVANAFSLGRGGTIDFQMQFQGGTFPNATAADNGVDVANDANNLLSVTTSSTGPVGSLVASGPVIFAFYRSDAGTADLDANANQGGNVISGGYKSRSPGAISPSNPNGDGTAVAGTVNFTSNPPAPDGAGGTAGTGGGYLGIVGTASPATLIFDTTPLSFFALTALPRNSTRDTLITLTQRPIGGGATSTLTIGGTTAVTTNAVFFAQTAATGFEFISAAITNPNGTGQNRYDDFAFIRSVPEPSTMALGVFSGLGMFGLARRRRA